VRRDGGGEARESCRGGIHGRVAVLLRLIQSTLLPGRRRPSRRYLDASLDGNCEIKREKYANAPSRLKYWRNPVMKGAQDPASSSFPAFAARPR